MKIDSRLTSLFPRILRIAKYVLGLTISGLLLGTLLFYLNRDSISQRFLEYAESQQAGEITIQEIHLSPFAHFPNVSLRFDSLVYFENFPENRGIEEKPILSVDHLYISFDLWEMIGGIIEVSEITLEDGETNIVFYPDSSINILNAISPEEQAKEGKEAKNAEQEKIYLNISNSSLSSINLLNPIRVYGLSTEGEKVDEEQEKIHIDLNNILLKNIRLSVDHQPDELDFEIFIKTIKSGFSSVGHLMDLRLNSDLEFIGLNLSSGSYLANKEVQFDVDLQYNDSSELIQISNGELIFQGLTFEMQGSFDIANEGYVDLELDASDEDLTLLSLFIEDDIIDLNPNLLEDGDISVSGTVRGKTIKNIPDLEFNFGASNLTLNLPDGIDPIRELGFEGRFMTGIEPDLSNAVLKIEDIQGILPGGYVRGSVEIVDFTEPAISIDWASEVELEGIDRAFKLSTIDSLSGFLSLKIQVDSKINLGENLETTGLATFEALFDSISFNVVEMDLPIQNLSGAIRQFKDRIKLDSISMQSGNNFIHMIGEVENRVGQFRISETEVKGNLQVAADLQSLRSFLPDWIYLPEHSLFDDSISNLEMDLSIESSVADLFNFNHFPSGVVQIHHSEAALEYLPPINEFKGLLNFQDDSLGLNIDFTNLIALLPKGKVDASGALRIDTFKHIAIKSDLNLEDIYFSRILEYISTDGHDYDLDSIQFGDSFISSSLHINTSFIHTPLSSADLSISDLDINFVNPDIDTIDISGMSFEFDDIIFEVPDSIVTPQDTTGFSNLSSIKGQIVLNKLDSKYFHESGLMCDIAGGNNLYEIALSSSDNLSGFIDRASLLLDFRGAEPLYELLYDLENVQIDSIVKDYYGQDFMSGVVNVSTNLSSGGIDLDQLLENINGSVLVEGNNIVVKGFDLDEILSNYTRSQNFNLADVGAIMVVGPFGAVVTKGADFVRISNINPDDSTVINRFHSSWTLSEGVFNARDVALTTPLTRIALTGRVDLNRQLYDSLAIAVIDEKGCSLMDQTIQGTFENPEFGEVNVAGTLFGAVINVFKIGSNNNCEPFYVGVVQHPEE